MFVENPDRHPALLRMRIIRSVPSGRVRLTNKLASRLVRGSAALVARHQFYADADSKTPKSTKTMSNARRGGQQTRAGGFRVRENPSSPRMLSVDVPWRRPLCGTYLSLWDWLPSHWRPRLSPTVIIILATGPKRRLPPSTRRTSSGSDRMVIESQRPGAATLTTVRDGSRIAKVERVAAAPDRPWVTRFCSNREPEITSRAG
jgi:hypothetical protein